MNFYLWQSQNLGGREPSVRSPFWAMLSIRVGVVTSVPGCHRQLGFLETLTKLYLKTMRLLGLCFVNPNVVMKQSA